MMDVKARPEITTQEVKKPKFSLGFIRELKEELKKVTWTSKAELIFFTKMVIGTTFLFGLGIYLIDLCIKGGLDIISMIVRFIFG
jgi:preprotein translocase subunit SecE